MSTSRPGRPGREEIRTVTRLLSILLVFLPAVAARADDPVAEVRMICATDALVPGSTARIGLFFRIRPEWHLYWNGQNDSGLPPQIDLILPEGYAAEKALWPGPRRHVSHGGVLDHIYEKEVLIIIPVHVPPDARPGERVSFSAGVEWLACKEQCVLEQGAPALVLPIAADAKPSRESRLFVDTQARLPRPLPKTDNPVLISFESAVLRVSVEGAEYLAFYPLQDSARAIDPIRECEAKGDTLSIRFEESTSGSSKPVRGVLEVRTRDRREIALYDIDLMRPHTGAHPDVGWTPQP